MYDMDEIENQEDAELIDELYHELYKIMIGLC